MEMTNCKYWETADRTASQNAQSFKELSLIAIRVLNRMKNQNPDIIMLSGPMWTGPNGPDKNHEIFEKATNAFVKAGYHVFKQMPFQEAMKRIQSSNGGTYPTNGLLEDFYGEIFKTDLIKKMAFIPGWSLSHGCTWEYNEGSNHGIICKVLPENYLGILKAGKKIKGL